MGTAPMWLIVLSAVTAVTAQEGMGTMGDIRGPGCHLVEMSLIGDVTQWGCHSLRMSHSQDITQ